MMHFLVRVTITVGLVINLTSCKNKQPAIVESNKASDKADTSNVNTQVDEKYHEIRDIYLKVMPEDLEISVPQNETKIYGVVLDWDLAGVLTTLASYQSGEAYAHSTNGLILMSGGDDKKVSTASKKFVKKAQLFFDKSAKIASTPLPDTNCITFYFLTSKGTFGAKEYMTNIDSSIWRPLFNEATNVITELEKAQKNSSDSKQ